MSNSIKCPKCLKENDLEKLEQHTEYGCWSGEEVGVSCMECEHRFDVSCEHRGYSPSCDSFDMSAFIKVYKVKVPENCSYTWATYYLKDLILYGTTEMCVPKPPHEHQRGVCKNSYEFATKEWERIQNELTAE
jgi:hypothetical protein